MGKNLAESLAAAQVEFKPALKQTKGQVGNQKYDYADLASINDATKTALAKNGLCIVSKTVITDHGLILETALIHGGSGERETAHWPLVTGRPQEMGSALTYARRYTICALLNIVGETDDDGNEGQKAPPANVSKPKETPFKMVSDDGEEVGFERPTEYLAAIEAAFKKSINPLGFWDSNSGHYQMWQTKYVKAGHAAAPEFNRVGKMIVDSLQGKAA